MRRVLPSVATLREKLGQAEPGSARRAGFERLLEEALGQRRCQESEGPGETEGARGAEADAASPQRRPKRSREPVDEAAVEAGSPSLRAMAAGVPGKVVLAAVQRVAVEVAMRQVQRAQAAKPKASELERMRRECDGWLRILATVRELPPYHVRFGNGASAVPSDYKYIKGGAPSEVEQLWAAAMPRDERRRRELRLLEERYARCSAVYWARFSARRVDAVRDELQEAARLTPNGFMAAAFRILRRTRPSACGNKARAPAPDLMCAIFEDGDDKDPTKLRTGTDGFAEELLKQGTEMYAAKPACMEAVQALLEHLDPVLLRLRRDEEGASAPSADEAAEAAALVDEVMTEARWRRVLGRVRERLAVGADGFPAYLLRQASPEVQGLYLDGLRDIVKSMDVPASWSEWPVILAPKPGKDRRLLRKRRDITLLQHGWSLLMKLVQAGYSEPVEAARPWCQAGFEAFRTPPSQTLGLRAAMEQAMALRIDIYIAFLDYMGFFNSIIRQVQRRCEAHFGVKPRLTDIIMAVHEAAKAFFETAQGRVGPADVRVGNGQGCPRGPDRSLLPLTVVIRAVQILGARGFVYAAPSGFERGVPQFWMADDGAFVSDSAEGVQLVFEAVWLSSLVLGLEIGWDTDASKTAWLGWRWEGNTQVPDVTSRITLPLGKDGADVIMPRVTDCYRHLGSEVTGRVDHSALRLRVESRVSTLLRLVGRLGGAELAQLRQCLLTVVRGVLGYYGRATPLGRALGERLDVELRKQLTGCGHRSGSGHVLQVIAPEKAGGKGIEPAWCTAAAALCDEVARGLAGRDGEPARLALESLVALTCHRLGYEPSRTCPTPLEWFPTHLMAHLSEELVVEAWLLYRLRTGVGARHSGATSQGALVRAAWVISDERAASPLLWEQLGCTFSRRLCALGLVRLADVYGGTGDGAAESAGDGPGGGGGGDDRGDEGAISGGRWLLWEEVQEIYGGGGVVFTPADAREYARLVRELDGRSLSRARRPLFGAGPGVDAPQTPATIEWRTRRARQRPGVDAELRLAREWLRRRASGALPVEAVRAARRCGDGLEFLVREQGALGDGWWAEARLNERLARAGGADGARLTAETQRAREAPVPQSFSAWLDARGERGVLEVAARRSDEAEVSEARCTLTRLYFKEYVPAAARAQAGATPISRRTWARGRGSGTLRRRNSLSSRVMPRRTSGRASGGRRSRSHRTTSTPGARRWATRVASADQRTCSTPARHGSGVRSRGRGMAPTWRGRRASRASGAAVLRAVTLPRAPCGGGPGADACTAGARERWRGRRGCGGGHAAARARQGLGGGQQALLQAVAGIAGRWRVHAPCVHRRVQGGRGGEQGRRRARRVRCV